MRRLTELRVLDLVYGTAICGGVYVDLWQYGVPSYTALAGGLYALFGIISGASIGFYRGHLSSRTELILLVFFTVMVLPLLHITSSAELGLTVVTGTWTAIAVERLRITSSTDQ